MNKKLIFGAIALLSMTVLVAQQANAAYTVHPRTKSKIVKTKKTKTGTGTLTGLHLGTGNKREFGTGIKDHMGSGFKLGSGFHLESGDKMMWSEFKLGSGFHMGSGDREHIRSGGMMGSGTNPVRLNTGSNMMRSGFHKNGTASRH